MRVYKKRIGKTCFFLLATIFEKNEYFCIKLVTYAEVDRDRVHHILYVEGVVALSS